MNYKVYHYLDDIYEVVDKDNVRVFKGTLSDCEAWIRLKERNYLNYSL